MSMTNLLFLWMYIYSCCFPFLHIKEKSTWAIKYDTRSYDVSVIYVSARKSLSYRYKNSARTKDFKDCTDFLNSMEFICLYLFYVVVLLRGTNEITLVFRRIETFIGDEKTLSQVRNRLNREIWFCKDFTPAGVTILKWNLTRYLIIREAITIGKSCCKNEMFREKFVLFVLHSLESSLIFLVALQFSNKCLITIYNYNIKFIAFLKNFQETKHIFLIRVTKIYHN